MPPSFLGDLPWAEKYRPKTLDDIADQEEVVISLKNILATRQVPHMLFTGPPGTGKTASAHAFARELFGDGYLRDGLFVEINASDERGIQTIREKVKSYARSVSFGDVGFRILLLDESDQLTDDAQHAFRRTMEQYSGTCRFILAANYSNRIIEPIQSRCAVFRFRPLPREQAISYLEKIAASENLSPTKSALEAIFEFAEGDMRRCINVLQASSTLGPNIDERIVYKVIGHVSRGEVRRLLELGLAGSLLQARDAIREMLHLQGISPSDLVTAIYREIPQLGLSEADKVELLDALGETDFRVAEGGTPEVQLMAFISKLAKRTRQAR